MLFITDQKTMPGFIRPSPMTGQLIAGLLASLFWLSAPADTQTELEILQSRIRQLSKELNKLQTSKESTARSLAVLEQRIGKTARELQTLEVQIHQVKQQRQSLQNSLVEQRRLLQRQKNSLALQLRIAYSLGRKAPVQLIMSLDDPHVISRILTYHRYLNKARLNQIDETQRQLDTIRTLNHELEQNEQHLAALLEQRSGELQQLKVWRSKREQVLAGIRNKLANKHVRLTQLENDRRRLNKLLDSASEASDDLPFPPTGNHSFRKQRGRFHWPVAGRIEIRYGAPRGLGHWEGVVIRAPEGSPVQAIHPGRVIFSDWLRGYGQLIIIRHDRDFMTLYAFNQTLLKEVGDLVKAGETIATVGNSGGRRRPGLYFAIRHRGEPVNPLRWCRHPRKNKVS